MIFSAVVDHDDAGNNRPTKNIIATAEANKISWVIETGLLGIYDEVPGKFGKWNRDFCFGGNPEGSSPVNADQLLEDSGLDYTTLRLPWLNDRPEAKHSITHRHDTYVDVSGSRQSMADVVLKIMADPTFGSRDSLGIADPLSLKKWLQSFWIAVHISCMAEFFKHPLALLNIVQHYVL